MRATVTLAVLVTLGLVGFPGFGQGQQRPASWLSFEEGNALVSQREFGKALEQYKNAIASAGTFPEAEMAIGDVYREEGELDLARKQYEKAYNMRSSFYIPDSKYDVLYKLARLFEDQDLFKLMEDRLNEIVADDKHFVETPTFQQKTQIEKNFLEKGLDRVLMLYTFDDTFSTNAHSELGWFYYRTGRYSQAISHLLFAIIYRVSELKAYMQERDVEFQFSTLQDLLSDSQQQQDASRYVAQEGLFKDLYYLAGSTFANGYPEHSRGIWKIIAESLIAGPYSNLSRRQLKAPFMEPLIGVN